MTSNLQQKLKIMNENIIKMFTVRGYDVSKEISYEQLILPMSNRRKQSGEYSHRFINNERSIVTFIYPVKLDSIQEIKFSKNEMRIYISKYREDVRVFGEDNDGDWNYTMMIIIGKVDNKTLNRINKSGKNLSYDNDNIVIEIFTSAFFALHPLDHRLTPPHKIFRNVDVDTFLEKYNMKGRIPPKIYLTDPISRLFGAHVGDYFEISRRSTTTGNGIMIREVVIDPRTYL